MELAIILLLFAAFLIFLKLLAVVLKTGFFILSIPFQIIAAILAVFLVLVFVPFVVVAGILTAVFAPLFIFDAFLPLLLVLLGICLVVKK
ncbi:MAG: hypothetical protein ACE5IW_08395 [bacterium]